MVRDVGVDETMTAHAERAYILPRVLLLAMAGSLALKALHAECQASSPQVQSTPTASSRPQAAITPFSEPVFDVAAIHQNIADQSGRSHIVSSPLDGHFLTVNASLMAIVRWALDMPEARILGAPTWLSSTRFDIDAKADTAVDAQLHGLASDASRLKKKRMVQALLADRFKLQTHRETKQLPIYVLVAAKGGAKLGAVQGNGTTVNDRRGQIEV